MPRHSSDWARLDVHTENESRTVKIEPKTTTSGIGKTFLLAEKTYKRLSLDKTLPAVLFEPEHLQLMIGRPELRRNFLDDLLTQLVGEFSLLRGQYKRVLAQRNALLKQGASATNGLFAWNVRLGELGGKIADHRLSLIGRIQEKLMASYKELSGSSTVAGLSYKTACGPDRYGSDLLEKLEKNTKLDFLRGFTAYGPHRDDMAMSLGGHDVAAAASRGEARTFLLGLKLAETSLLEEVRQQKPLLLLDDVFSELDGKRRRALTSFLSGYQTFITTTDADVVVQHFMDNCHIIAMES